MTYLGPSKVTTADFSGKRVVAVDCEDGCRAFSLDLFYFQAYTPR